MSPLPKSSKCLAHSVKVVLLFFRRTLITLCAPVVNLIILPLWSITQDSWNSSVAFKKMIELECCRSEDCILQPLKPPLWNKHLHLFIFYWFVNVWGVIFYFSHIQFNKFIQKLLIRHEEKSFILVIVDWNFFSILLAEVFPEVTSRSPFTTILSVSKWISKENNIFFIPFILNGGGFQDSVRVALFKSILKLLTFWCWGHYNILSVWGISQVFPSFILVKVLIIESNIMHRCSSEIMDNFIRKSPLYSFVAAIKFGIGFF